MVYICKPCNILYFATTLCLKLYKNSSEVCSQRFKVVTSLSNAHFFREPVFYSQLYFFLQQYEMVIYEKNKEKTCKNYR